MKKLLYAFLLLPASLQAQQLEFGLGGGIATNTKPSDNMYYKGDKMTIKYAGSAVVLYNINSVLQAGLEAHLTELSMKSDQVYAFYKGGTIGGDNKKIMFAKTAISFCAVANAKLLIKNGYGYIGVAAGYGAARQDSKKLNSNESYRAANGGNGLSVGAQVGYVLGLSDRLALNAELAMRYFMLKYDAAAPGVSPEEKLKYNIMSLPFTIGIRYQLFDSESKERKRQKSMNVGGEE